MSDRRIWIACLGCYNEGRLTGQWVDATQDADTLIATARELVQSTPHCKAGGHEEYAIHDYDGFEGLKLGEYEDMERVSAIANLLDDLDDDAEPFALWFDNEKRSDIMAEDLEESFRACYLGTWRTVEDYAEQLCDDLGMLGDCNETVKRYFDYEAFARDMVLGGDIWTENGGEGVYVFDNNV